MAEIVAGIGTAHTPQMSIAPDKWTILGDGDRNHLKERYDVLMAERGPKLQDEVTPSRWQEKYQRAQDAVAKLGKFLEETRPDVLVIVGDDQDELWGPEGQPALALFMGDLMWDHPIPETQVPAPIRMGLWAWHHHEPDPYPIEHRLSRHLLESLIAQNFDVTQFSRQIPGRPLGHAFTFARRRLGLARHVPIVPVILNAHYPPNQPTPTRCLQLGRALREAINAWPVDARVVMMASGGLTHWLIDESLDRGVLDALESGQVDRLATLTREQLTGGTSEVRAWITVGAALSDFKAKTVDYIPGYRSLAGTGVGMGFLTWQ
ncbi:MAG: hypothetical protein K6U14_07065 [Firmicutes bacterium]|nr:hypothetical protein [Alicyclobacillaceae bacterium]MCL6497378.1 hypothetical protein [Bacillota bacterium]